MLQKIAPVEVLCFSAPAEDQAPEKFVKNGLKVTVVSFDRATLFKRIFYPLRPYFLNGVSKNMKGVLKEKNTPDTLLYVCKLNMAAYIPYAKQLGFKVILDNHNVESDLILDQVRSSPKNFLHWPIALQYRRHEKYFCESSDAVISVSPEDQKILKKMCPTTRVEMIPNTIDCDWYTMPPSDGDNATLFFIGSLDYLPNIQGLKWFAESVLPLLKEKLEINLPPVVVAGARPAPELVSMLEASGIQVVINPPDAVPLLSRSMLTFVPLFEGSGTRLKILESLAASKPVVSTTKGVEGLDFTPDCIRISDTPEGFARAIIDLVENPHKRQTMAHVGLAEVRAKYDWRGYAQQIRTIVEQTMG